MQPDDFPYALAGMGLVGLLVGTIWGYYGGRNQEAKDWRDAAHGKGLIESDGQLFGVWPAIRPLPDEIEDAETIE